MRGRACSSGWGLIFCDVDGRSGLREEEACILEA